MAQSQDVPTTGIYPDVHEHPVPEDLSQFEQPRSLVEDMKAITSGSLDDRLEALKEKSRRDQVFVAGGAFLMGDFGPRQSKEGLPWTGNADTKPLHKVYLDDFSISKYKVTQAELDLYTEANGLPRIAKEEEHKADSLKKLSVPAEADWDSAQAYCEWLGTLIGSHGGLPSEAQWEYAARDRGKFIVFATNTGELEINQNVPTFSLLKKLNQEWYGVKYGSNLPIGLFPPTPLGLYDMTMLAKEWVYDWYSPTYYKDSEGITNPKGPLRGEEKVIRSQIYGQSSSAKTMYRASHEKTSKPNEKWWVGRNTFRCVSNQ